MENKTIKYKWGSRSFEVCEIPKNKMRVGLLGFLGLIALITPLTNGFYIGGLKALMRFKPLWIYN